jgi:hypothetical protein
MWVPQCSQPHTGWMSITDSFLSALVSAQGRGLAPLLLEDTSDTRHVWFIEHHVPDGGWIPSSEGIRTSRWKYLRYTDAAAPYEELYDLDHDPHETISLAGNAMYAREQNVLTRYWRRWSAGLRGTDGPVAGASDRSGYAGGQADLVGADIWFVRASYLMSRIRLVWLAAAPVDSMC